MYGILDTVPSPVPKGARVKGSKRVLRYARWRMALGWGIQFLLTSAIMSALLLSEWTFGPAGFWTAYACVIAGGLIWIPLELRAIRIRYWRHARWRSLVHERHRRMLQRKLKKALEARRPAA